ncbi:hypothetical protein F4775DRAFT_593591 [Biscogniauxia sp. FL1348]|nr:hypothetical protein F4775DRAFT_593591 [Biscogniauxia sp. FL1348]
MLVIISIVTRQTTFVPHLIEASIISDLTQFGDRCKLCTVMNEGAPANYDVLRFLTDGDFTHERTRPERDNSSREERRSRGRDRNSMIRRS